MPRDEALQTRAAESAANTCEIWQPACSLLCHLIRLSTQCQLLPADKAPPASGHMAVRCVAAAASSFQVAARCQVKEADLQLVLGQADSAHGLPGDPAALPCRACTLCAR